MILNKLINNFKELDLMHFFFDLTFYILGIIAFYNNYTLFPVPLISMVALTKYKQFYKRNKAREISQHLIEFLNYINSNLSIGMSFEQAILSYEKDHFSTFDHEMKAKFEKLINAIKMGMSRDQLLSILETVFPIRDTKRFSTMLRQSMRTGANQSFIVSITLDKLYVKHRTESEIELILFQKKTEQMILCIAPMFIILMIRQMSPEYLTPLYSSLLGHIIMTISFTLLILMKVISRKIIQIEI